MTKPKQKRSPGVRGSQPRRAGPKKRGNSKFIFYLFLTIALVALGLGGLAAVNTAREIAGEIRLPAVVTDLVSTRSGEGSVYFYPVVEIDVPGEGRVTVKTDIGSWPPDYFKGDSVTVLYDPGPPRQAHIDTPSNNLVRWVLVIIPGALGGAFLIAAFVSLWILNQPLPDDPVDFPDLDS